MKTLYFFVALTLLLASCSTTRNTGSNSNDNTSSTASGTSASSRTILTSNIAPGMEKEILQLINQYRASKGLPTLKDLPLMSQEARKHSLNMASGKISFGHLGFETRKDIVVAQYKNMSRFAENVAYGAKSAKEVVDGWIKSPGHKKNIEGDFSFSGIGVARNSKNQLYYTQLFAK